MTKIKRRKTKVIKIGNIEIGGNNPISIQSMTKTKTADTQATLRQIEELRACGCQILRLAVKDMLDAKSIKTIKNSSNIALVADIHFNWRLAIEAIDNGVDKIRLNPGNIYRREQIKEIVTAAKRNHIPIRVGVNSGSLKYVSSGDRAGTCAERMVKSALGFIKLIEGFKFYDLVVSLKGSDIIDTIEAYRKISALCNYPLHLGVTASGPFFQGIIKSSIAIGTLLQEGIGDTIRVSLTDSPKEEIKVAKTILEVLGLRHFGPEIISCPTCGRCEVDLVKLVKDLDVKLSTLPAYRPGRNYELLAHPPKVAVMGCVVNGPGEASSADIGVAFGKKDARLFRKGKIIRRISFANCIEEIFAELKKNS